MMAESRACCCTCSTHSKCSLKAALVQIGERVFDKETGRSIGFEKCLGLTVANAKIKLNEADAGRGAAADGDVAEERRQRAGDLGVLRHADAADRAAGARDADRGVYRRAVPDALQHRVDALAAGELSDTLDGLLAAVRDDVGGAEVAGQRDPVAVAAHDDLLGAEALGGDDGAQADGTVADDRGALGRRQCWTST
jgi:hypothetical protein